MAKETYFLGKETCSALSAAAAAPAAASARCRAAASSAAGAGGAESGALSVGASACAAVSWWSSDKGLRYASSVKRDLLIWQKRPSDVAKEA